MTLRRLSPSQFICTVAVFFYFRMDTLFVTSIKVDCINVKVERFIILVIGLRKPAPFLLFSLVLPIHARKKNVEFTRQ